MQTNLVSKSMQKTNIVYENYEIYKLPLHFQSCNIFYNKTNFESLTVCLNFNTLKSFSSEVKQIQFYINCVDLIQAFFFVKIDKTII